MNILNKIRQEIKKSLEKIDLLKHENIEETLEAPPQEQFGDLASNICFSLSKKLKQSPQKIAEEIVSKIKTPKDSIISKVEAKGGYVNFFFDYTKLSKLTLNTILKERKKYGHSTIGKKQKVMVEFSQPNPVHPMHIGHARTTFLGDSLSNILEFNNYKVVRANYMNDLGLQVAKLVTAYLMWGKNKKPDEKPDMWLWKYYVKFHEELKEKPELEEKAREILRKFEILKDKQTLKLWRKIVDWCIDGFKETYKNTGIKFDIYLYESDFRDSGKKLVEETLKKKIAFKSSEGTIVADLEKYGMPSFVLLRSDGTGLYQTSDLGMTVYKFNKYKLDKSIWVVSSQQNLYFKQLFKTLELLNYPWVKNCYHLSFEHVVLPEGKMSSREGKAIMLDEVVDKLTKLALKEVEKRNPKLSKKQKKDIAKKIGIGALKYAILKIEPNNMITFDWKQMLSFEGNTGPYIQYAHTRCNGIFKKAGKWKKNLVNKNITILEKKLIKKLMEFPNIVEQSGKDFKPHYICNYVYDLTNIFSEFYHSCPVLKAENKDLKNFRLTLVKATQITIENSLKLLGIETPKIM